MFYEETYIDGVLMCRSTPDGEWQEVAHSTMSARLAKAEAQLAQVREHITGYYRALDRREHGGAAQDNSFSKIEGTLGMFWQRGATLGQA